eukprot:CAMPEP_0167785390 /NCGR_PEP_ID=MMETSP0111_2-20121227/8208_1 /TAXON_ID=91324 /ORGANISM="Lotharella globosa, Strain CCCM811" /LENGTH=82 /DNA_ID=CAMNT_0007676651 /DNA_START=357 /DNA_END=605 /DNA_ORIENTATION=+
MPVHTNLDDERDTSQLTKVVPSDATVWHVQGLLAQVSPSRQPPWNADDAPLTPEPVILPVARISPELASKTTNEPLSYVTVL